MKAPDHLTGSAGTIDARDSEDSGDPVDAEGEELSADANSLVVPRARDDGNINLPGGED